MELKEFDIVIRETTVDKSRRTHQITVIGHEEDMTFVAGSAMDALRRLNMALFNHSIGKRRRLEAQFTRIQDQLKRDSGIKPWQFWRKPSNALRERMDDIVIEVCKEFPKGTYEQIGDETLRRWNQCPDIDRMGHECDQHCHQNGKL